MRDTERQRYRQREKHTPCREPDVGLDPKTPGSQPEPKADRCSTTKPPRCPRSWISNKYLLMGTLKRPANRGSKPRDLYP